MSTYSIYYIQTNLMCIIILSVVLINYAKDTRATAESKWFKMTIMFLALYCVSDITAAVCKNKSFEGVRQVLWLANSLYIAMPMALVLTWQRFTYLRTMRYAENTRVCEIIRKLSVAVAVSMIVLCLSSPFTHFAFNLDSSNVYHRSAGAYAVPVLTYMFLIYELLRMVSIMKKTALLEAKTDARTLSLFSLPCVILSIIQLAFYGVTLSQVGFTLGIIIVYVRLIRESVSKDGLTSLNNRREYEYEIDRLSRQNGDVFIAMIDIDSFKQINDTYGHAEGDKAIQYVSDILRTICGKTRDLCQVALYRYGGDEFVFVSSNYKKENISEKFEKIVEETVMEWNLTHNEKYELSLSVGSACGEYEGSDVAKIISMADQDMYRKKTAKKNASKNMSTSLNNLSEALT